MKIQYNLVNVDLDLISIEASTKVIERLSKALAGKIFDRKDYDQPFIRQILSDAVNEVSNNDQKIEYTFNSDTLIKIEKLSDFVASTLLQIRKEHLQGRTENCYMYDSYLIHTKEAIVKGTSNQNLKIANEVVAYETTTIWEDIASVFGYKSEKREIYRTAVEDTAINYALGTLVDLSYGTHRKYQQLNVEGTEKLLLVKTAKGIVSTFTDLVEAKAKEQRREKPTLGIFTPVQDAKFTVEDKSNRYNRAKQQLSIINGNVSESEQKTKEQYNTHLNAQDTNLTNESNNSEWETRVNRSREESGSLITDGTNIGQSRR